MHQVAAYLLMALALSACGGGGSSPPPTNNPPVANAGMPMSVLAGTLAALDGSASTDPEAAALSYRWELSSKPASSKAVLTNTSAVKPSFTPDVAGTYVATLTVNDGAQNGTPSTVSITAVPADAVEIKADRAEPLTGTVKLSLSVLTEGAVIHWRRSGSEALGEGASILLNTGGPGTVVGLANGLHLIEAELVVAGTSARIARNFYVRHDVLDADVSYAPGETLLTVYAPTGTTSVSASLGNLSLGTLNAPNVCDVYCPSGFNLHQFRIVNAKVGTGNYMATIMAVDGSGKSQSFYINVPITAPTPIAPSVDLSAPANGSFVFGQLPLAGSTTGGLGDTVTLTVLLDGTQVLQTTDPKFKSTIDISQLAPGVHTLVVRGDSAGGSTSFNRRVIVASRPELAYTSILPTSSSATLLAANGPMLVYLLADESVHLRDVSAGTDLTLLAGGLRLGSTLTYSQWQLSDAGHAVGLFAGSDCSSPYSCVYLWRPDGSRVNLSASTPFGTGSDGPGLLARDGVVAWEHSTTAIPNSYTLYDIATGNFRQILVPCPPCNKTRIFDLVQRQGVVSFVGQGDYGASSRDINYDLFLWRSDTGTSASLTSSGAGNSKLPHIDGDQVFWRGSETSGGALKILASPLKGGSTTQVLDPSSPLQSFDVRDGVLAWAEGNLPPYVIKARSSEGNIATLSTGASTVLYGTRGGIVVYGENGAIYSWNAATGQTTKRLDPVSVKRWILAGDRMYFVLEDSPGIFSFSLK